MTPPLLSINWFVVVNVNFDKSDIVVVAAVDACELRKLFNECWCWCEFGW